MKQFLTYTILFLLFAFAVYHAKPLYLLINDKYKTTVAGSEIYYAIEKSKKKSKTKKALFGDSVARQLFNSNIESDTINSLATNQAIALVGQYILLNNYLQAGNQVDTVYFLLRPFTFQNNLDQVYTYHYFLKPFYTDEYLKYFTPTVMDQIQKIPHVRFRQLPSILTSDWAPEFITTDTMNYTFLSPVSIDYLKKIKELASQYRFKLIILPTPINSALKSKIDQFDRNEIISNGFQKEFTNYFENITYLDNRYFSDSSHLVNPAVYTELYKQKFFRP